MQTDKQNVYEAILGSRLINVSRRKDKIYCIFQIENWEPAPKETENIPYEEIIALYHEYLPMGSKVRILSKAKKGQLRQRWLKEIPERLKALGQEVTDEKKLNYITNFFRQCAQSRFITGQVAPREGHRAFKVTFEWLFRPEIFAKIVEGFYNQN